MRYMRWLGLFLLLSTACQVPAPQATQPPASTPLVNAPISNAPQPVEVRPIVDGPTLLRGDIKLRQVMALGAGNIRLVRNPADQQVYLLNPGQGISRLLVGSPGNIKPLIALSALGPGTPTGMAFGPEGELYVVLNQPVDKTYNQATVRKGTPAGDGKWTWSTLAQTEPYELSGTNFDHQFNGIAVSADGEWIYLNSGSRTDHGEVQNNKGAFKDVREVALTTKILRVPSDSQDLRLPNDEAQLEAGGYIFARGTRNAYDLEFAPNGELFAGDNGPDADLPDELNWLREGLHYGFPWKFGNEDNPQQFPDYTSVNDKRLQPDFVAVQTGAYRRDPTFPKPPEVEFTLPVANLGPAAAQYRAVNGSAQDAAANGETLYSFTPHRSPLGLVFLTSESLPADLLPMGDGLSAFILSWGAAGGTLTDKGQDLLHLQLTRNGDNYQMVATQVARDFKNPIDAVLIDNRLYVLEFGGGGSVWELTFER